jgi:NADH dehydrogenase [ubiquinone] 1 alpha subcomplex assembly factor 5
MRAPESHPLMLFDRPAWRRHRERAARQGAIDFLHVEIVKRLIDRLDHIPRWFSAALDVGAQSGALSRALAARPGIECVVSLDPAIGFLSNTRGVPVAGDPELLPFAAQSFDLALSALTLHWAADLPGALVQLRRVLKPDGLLLAAMFGGATLVELRGALIEAELAEEGGVSPRVSPTADLADIAALLQRAGFAMPVADADTITATYPDITALMRDLRGMGETNALTARRKGTMRRATLARAAAIYHERHRRADGRIPATFEILYLTGWAPGSGQPQPLKPGTARRRLADALGTVEFFAGDSTRSRPG